MFWLILMLYRRMSFFLNKLEICTSSFLFCLSVFQYCSIFQGVYSDFIVCVDTWAKELFQLADSVAEVIVL